jgi:hypothetical protein
MRRELLTILVGVAASLGGCVDTTQSEFGEYTILLKSFAEPDHVAKARHYRDETEKRTHWQGLNVVDEGSRSQLYWGKYASIQAAAQNLRRAKQWRAPAGINIYAMAIVIRTSTEDIGPSQWNLRNAKGWYTVVVAMYYNMPAEGFLEAYTQRKEDAVDYCDRLRRTGVEAYFLHEAAKSYVTIGTFPESAVVSVQRGNEFVKEISNDRMKALIVQYPRLGVNGREEYTYVPNPKTRKKEKVISASYPMEIPGGTGIGGNIPRRTGG